MRVFGHNWINSCRKEHVCWCCSKTIPIGSKMLYTSGLANDKMFMVKHCRECEIVPEILDQNPKLAEAVRFTSIEEWRKTVDDQC